MLREENRRTAALFAAVAGWGGALLLAILRVADVIPQDMSVFIVLLIGIAISAGLSLTRSRLERTMIGVFKAGVSSVADRTLRRDVQDDRRKDEADDRRAIEALRRKDRQPTDQ